MDPIRNPYAPGAGQRPPELAGRDIELRAFDVVLERVVNGRPERSLVLTGLLLPHRAPPSISRGGQPVAGRVPDRANLSLDMMPRIRKI